MSNINFEKFATYLRKTLPSLNIELNMVGINASINEKNPLKIDFYDKRNNDLLHSEDFSQKISNLKNIISLDGVDYLNAIYDFSFIDFFGQTITCTNYLNKDNVFNCCRVQKDGKYEFNIAIKINGKGINYFRVQEYDPNDYYYVKTFEIDENGLIECSILNPSKDTKNIFAISPLYSNNPKISILGNINNNKKTIYCDEEGISTTSEDIRHNMDYSFKKETFKFELDNILCHPWNKKVLEFTMDEFEKKYPGFKNFISYNFSLYNHIMNTEYDPNTESGGIVDSTIGDMEAIPKYVNGITKVRKDANH